MRLAIAQFTVSDDKTANLDQIAGYAREAAAAGADLLVCPEAAMVRLPDDDKPKLREEAEPLDGPFVTGLRKASAETGLTVLAGMHEPATGGDGRVHNTAVVVAGGELTGAYRKLHLYDAFSKRESEHVAPGAGELVTFACGDLTVGVATCYDLRFPEIFRELVDRGAEVFAVPAAWVRGSLKEEHWLTLLRARAIENTCYAAGAGEISRSNIGRSAVFDPLGLQLTDLGETPALGLVEVRPERLSEARVKLPALTHRRYRVARI
jgi:deaminated glutathione amidase